MGKKNKGGINATRLILGGYDRELERFGVEGFRYGGKAQEMTGKEYRSEKDVEKDLLKAAAGDASFVNALQSAAMSGKGKAKKILDKGLQNVGDLTNANNFLEKSAKRHGQGGSFSSPSDHMGLAYSMAKRDRAKQTAAYDETYAKTTDLNALKDKLMAEATDKAAGTPIEPSDRMAAVEERMEGAAGNAPPSMFDKDNAQPAKADDQKDAARNFLDDYKLDVAKGANIKSDIETGVSNAAKHVRDTYGR